MIRMSTRQQHPAPEFNQDLSFQQRSWRVQRIGWVLIGIIILLALLGLFGHGLWSQTTARDPSLPISLTYPRFERYQSSSTLRVRIDKRLMTQTIAIWFSKDYVSRIEIQEIVPKPEQAETSSTGMIYTFRTAAPENGAEILVHLQMQAIGLVAGRIGLDDSHALSFWQWVYP